MISILGEALKTLQETVQNSRLDEQVRVIADRTKKTLQSGNKILLCGNGGSAAEAQHIAAEFVGRFKKERRALPAIAFTTDTSILTAVSNDYSYDLIFARQVEALGEKGDLLFLLSTSGNSKNCVMACEKAKSNGITTVGFTGSKGGKLKEVADLCFCVPSDVTSHIQEVHLVVLHTICELIDEAFSS